MGFSSFAVLQNNESIELLLEKINLLKKEIESLTASIETNNLTISRLEEANQIRYVDLDKRIHLLETKLLFEETQAEESLEQSINPLSGLIEEDIDSGEFGLWSNSMKLLDNSRYSEAAENLRFLILSYPKGAYLVDSYFWLAEIYFLQEMNEDAYETYLSLINNFPDHERVPVSLYKLGLISIKLEKNEEAIAFFERVILNYPESGSSILSEQELLKFKS